MRDRKPRLLMLITLSELGGAQTAVALLLPGIVAEFEVTVAAQGSGPLRVAAETAGARYVELHHVRRPIDPWHDALALVELIRLCRQVGPDIVHVHSSKMGVLGRLAAWLAHVPIRVLTVHGWSFAPYHGPSRSLFVWIERLMRPVTTTVVCVSEKTRQEGVAARACDPRRSVVIHNAVDVHAFAHAPRRDRTAEVVGVGRFAYPKDFATLLEALRLVEAPCRVRLVGDGPELDAVASALDRMGLSRRVQLLGARADVPDLLASSDIFVLSSRSEGFPVSVLEAMAAGLPVVATDVGGVAEAVEEGETGFLVPAGDSEALARGLERLLVDGELRHRLGAAGRARARSHFDVSPYRAAYAALYRRDDLLSAATEPGEQPVARSFDVPASRRAPLAGGTWPPRS
jgi:glycosyltransferase involved in cell wall biosynthesis